MIQFGLDIIIIKNEFFFVCFVSILVEIFNFGLV